MILVPSKPDRDALRRALATLQAAVADDDAAGPTVGEIWDAYWREHGQYLLSARRMEYLIRGPMARWRDLPALACDLAWARQWMAVRSHEKTRRGMPPSPTTVNRELGYLHMSLAWATRRRVPLLPHDPLAGLKRILPAEPRRQGSVYREADLSRLCDELPPWARAALLVGALSGARVSVVLAIQWDDVDWETGDLRVRIPENSRKKRGRPWLPPAALEALREVPRLCAWPFANPATRRPYSGSQYRRVLAAAARRAGVTTADGCVVPHHLRHGFALRALEAWRWSVKQTMEHGGWSSPASLLRYGALSVVERQAAHEQARSMLPDRRGPQSVTATYNLARKGSRGTPDY